MKAVAAASPVALAALLSLCAAVGGTQRASSSSALPPPPPPAAEDVCSKLPMAFPWREDITAHVYNNSTETLSLDLYDLVYKFCDDVIYSDAAAAADIRIMLDLVSTTRRVLRNKRCPSESDGKTRLQKTLFLKPENPVASFDQVQGRYFLRFSICPRYGQGRRRRVHRSHRRFSIISPAFYFPINVTRNE